MPDVKILSEVTQRRLLKTFQEQAPVPVWDSGSVQLVDFMGGDQTIVNAARISYGKGTRRTSGDEHLIRYLMRHRHWTPFEMTVYTFRVRVDMATWRQWIRHRASSVNEYSTRYSEAIDSKQRTDPSDWRLQSTTNKQGSSGLLDSWPGQIPQEALENETPGEYLSRRESEFHHRAHQIYQERLKLGIAREQARKDLPLSTYTEAYWKSDLRNLFNFLVLRLDSHAQLEIREYAKAMAGFVKALNPVAYSAFEDYMLESMTLSRLELILLQAILGGHRRPPVPQDYVLNMLRRKKWSGFFPNVWKPKNSQEDGKLVKCRERDEAFTKLELMGIISA